MNKVLEVIDNRMSVRVFKDKDISKEHRDLIIHSAMRAPTAGNMMLYTMLEVEKQSDKDKLAKTCDNQPFIADSPFVIIFLADMQRWYDFFEYSGIKDIPAPEESDLLLAASDANIAAQNAVIAAESLGIGSCYIGDIMENIEIHKEMFNLPDMVFPVAMLCFGYKKEESKRSKTPRFPTEYIVHKNSYKRFKGKDFDNMFKSWSKIKNFLPGAENLGQHIYLRKTSADFSEEMRRSVAKGINLWKGEA